jgi:hydroxylamine reductase
MYCNQCEQTSKGIACTAVGVCGKDADTAALQDLLLHSLRKLSVYALKARQAGVTDQEVNRFTLEGLFVTLTNVNFDPESISEYIKKSSRLTAALRRVLNENELEVDNDIPSDLGGLIKQGEQMGMLTDKKADPDIQSLQQILVYGLKGIAAYAYHACRLGYEDERIYAFLHEAMAVIGEHSDDLQYWLNLVLRCGEVNVICMELLDRANTISFGHPVPTKVLLGHRTGKCILVSGHDLGDLKAILEATQGKGIDVYTHGEMLPAHGYPELKKYEHFYGHYGTAWQNQRKEFANFPGPILMTTNCIQEPRDSYINSIFTTGPVSWPGAPHVNEDNFAGIVQMALEMPGFTEKEDAGSVMCGFAHNAVLGVADKVIAGVKSGHIRHFLLVGGCDGARAGRSYYREIVERAPQDTVILTLGCGKYRFFDQKLGDIDGIPRLLDLGQCNDAYSAVQIALALAQAFDCGVNDLPLSLVLSWYEQKAVAILLSLLYLGIKNIRLGPTLPAFITPAVLNVLVENYSIKPITNADADLEAILS